MSAPSLPVASSLGLTAADAIWIATAMLHERHPEATGFTPAQIQAEVEGQQLTGVAGNTVHDQIVKHVTATEAANPDRLRILTETGSGLRRLFLDGDEYHPSRKDAASKPKSENLPPHLRSWLSWYGDWAANHAEKRKRLPAANLMDALEGTWKFGDAKTYLGDLREGWQ